jgi:hypothetical protein
LVRSFVAAARESHETISRAFPFLESFRSESCASGRARPASGHCSFSDCPLHCKRCLRHPRHLAQAISSGRSGLFQPGWGGDNRPVSHRDRPRRMAMAARRCDTERQSPVASDLRADFRSAHPWPLLETVTTPGKGRVAGRLLFCSHGARANDDHSDRTSWWNPQRRRSTVNARQQNNEQGYFKYLSNHPTVFSNRSAWFFGSRKRWPSPG